MVKLSDPITIRDVVFKNRLGFPPMLSFSSNRNGAPTSGSLRIYEDKARGGAGLITYENTNPDPPLVISASMAHIGTEKEVRKYKKLTDKIHEYHAKIGMQMGYGGIIALMFSGFMNMQMITSGPSVLDPVEATSAQSSMVPGFADRLKKLGSGIHELNIEEIAEIEEKLAQGAVRVKDAGFDYIDIHSGHGMLFSAFLSRFYNRRSDEYGGTVENRCRFLVETIGKMRKAVGEKFPIFVRFSADELLDDANNIKDGIEIAQILEKGGADCLDITQGIIIRSPDGIEVPTYVDHGGYIHFAEAIKEVVNIPVIGVGRIIDPRMADKFIQQGKADIIYMGRQLLCDPETPNKYFSGRIDEIKYCIGCLQGCRNGVCIYDDYSGAKYQELKPSIELKKIVILGAGVAGMEAGRVAKLRGHEVEIYEKSNKIGGLIPLVASEYKKEDFMNIVKYLEHQLNKLGVPIHLNRDLTREQIDGLKPDILVLATGSDATIPVNLKDKANVINQDEAILKTKPLGKNLIVWGLDTYWRGGSETAITLDSQGYNVKALVGPELGTAQILRGDGDSGRSYGIFKELTERNIPIYTEAKLLDVNDNTVKFLDKNKKEVSIQADNLIYCGARITNAKRLKEQFEGAAPEIVLIGDCKKPQDIGVAMRDAQTFARSLK
ncbi:MAG: FAD-dependent oxidoreductase [Candidatus Lokiarchaeota archaeon]|nr:FAD-dependent oxidoreductase [Candidatus Lokiarchaeota archaeon]